MNRSNTKTDLAKLDAHKITAEEYRDIPELGDDFFANAIWTINGKPSSAAEAKKAMETITRSKPCLKPITKPKGAGKLI